ncbi:MAG TPA: DUF3467 domain-containing protein [Patescibacteria group bacterium]|nr:DUF3467 domain-containing protein [Patescibacteria group bacterium]
MSDQNQQQNQQNQGQKQIQLKMSEEVAKGFYANAMLNNHTKEEFVLDFMSIFGQNGTMGARVIVSPGHFKRMIRAMEENLKKYEEAYGKVEEAKGQTGDQEIGFKG